MPPRKPISSRGGPAKNRDTDQRPSPFVKDLTGRKQSPFTDESIEAMAPDREGGEDAGGDGESLQDHNDQSYETGHDYPVAESDPGEELSGEYRDPRKKKRAAKPSDSIPDASDEAVDDPGGTVDPDSPEADGEPSDDEGERPSDFSNADDDLAPMEDDFPRSRTETRVKAVDDAEPEDEGDEKDDATRAGPPIKLKIIGGPDQGKSKKFSGVRMVIGRTNGCELKLSDQSVSRRHLELVKGEKGILLRDLGSGNGTKVNGEKVTEKMLEDGDEIAIGKTKFKFVDELAAFKKLRDAEAAKEAEGEKPAEGEKKEGEAPEAAAKSEGGEDGGDAKPEDGEKPAAEDSEGKNASTKPMQRRLAPGAVPTRRGGNLWEKLDKKQRLYAMAGGGALLLLLIIVIGLVATRKPAPPPVDPSVALAQQKMQDARAAVRGENYDDALKLADAARKLNPNVEGADELIKRATEELAGQKATEAIKALIDASKFDDARAELAKFPTTSQRYDKAPLEKLLADKEAEYKIEQIKALIAEGTPDALAAARQALADVPADKASGLADQLAQREEEAKNEARKEAVVNAVNAKKRNQIAAAEREAEIEEMFLVVQRKFNQGEYARAAGECDRVIDEHGNDAEVRQRAKLLQSLIPSFGRNFEEGHKKFKAGQLASAVKPLRKARELYLQMHFQGALGDQINEELAAAAIAAGRDALARDDLATAAVNFRDAVKLDPADANAKQGLEQVSSKAEDLYQEAYMIRDRDPKEAIAKFRLVIEVTPSGSPYHEKAKNQLAQLEPQ